MCNHYNCFSGYSDSWTVLIYAVICSCSDSNLVLVSTFEFVLLHSLHYNSCYSLHNNITLIDFLYYNIII